MDEELPSESAGPEVVDTRPIIEKIGDKNWKARFSAYEDLKKEFEKRIGASEDVSELLQEYASWLTKMTSDSNAGALDAGIDAALAYVDACSVALSTSIAEKVYNNIIEKTFNARASTAAKGRTLLLKMIEIDEPTQCTTILLSKLGDKKVKIPPTCLDLIKEGIVLFGAKPFPIKEIIKSLGPVLNGSNGPARESALALMVEIYRWIGQPPLQSLLDSLRPVQKSDFEKVIAEKEEEFSNTPTIPKLWLRKDRPLPGTEVESTNNVVKKAKKGPIDMSGGIDAREFVDEVDLNKKLKSSEFSTLIAEEKWSEQLKGLQIVIDSIGPVPKLKSGTETGEIIDVIKGFLRQGHIQLQVSSLKIISLIADGLRAEFSSSVRPLTQSIIFKIKEKRLVNDVQQTLRNILLHCLSFEPIADDLLEQIKNKKSPVHSKVGAMEFILTVLNEMPTKVANDSLKPIAEALISVAEDPDPKVREASSLGLASLAPIVKGRGKNAVDTHKLLMGLEQTLPKVFKKMMDGPGTSATAAPTKPSGLSNSKDSSAGAFGDNDDNTSVGQQSMAAVKKTINTKSATVKKSASAPSTSSRPPTAGNKKSSAQSSNNENDDNVEDLILSPEDAQVALEGLEIPGWDGPFQTQMASSKWQDKVEALNVMEQRIIETKSGGKFSSPMVVYLSAQTNGFKISNINIVKGIIQLACSAAQNCGSEKFNKSAAWEMIKQFGDKLSDKKTKEVVDTLLTALSEAISPAFVVKRMKVVMDKVKAPVAHQYYLEWLRDSIKEFGCGAFPVPLISSLCQIEMENKTGGVRSAAIEVMGVLYNQIGPRLQSIAITDDMKPQIKSLLEAEFARVGHDPSAAAKATRVVQGADGVSAGGQIPRQDLSSVLDKNLAHQPNQHFDPLNQLFAEIISQFQHSLYYYIE